jgi:hypothetical protein
VGTAAAGFPSENLEPLEGKTYYSVDYRASGEFDPSPLRFWAFPLAPAQDRYPQAIFTVGEDQDSFNGEMIQAVLQKAGEVFLPPGGPEEAEEPGVSWEPEGPEETSVMDPSDMELHAADSSGAAPPAAEGPGENSFDIETELTKIREQPGTFDIAGSSSGGLLSRITKGRAPQEQEDLLPASAVEKTVMDILSAGHEKFGSFQGLIIEALRYSADEFTGRIGTMVSTFGLVQGIAPGRCLVLFDAARDGELIARHLMKTVPGKNIFNFEAEGSQEAFVLLKPYL